MGQYEFKTIVKTNADNIKRNMYIPIDALFLMSMIDDK
jgi:hypothetical protein